MTDWLTILQNDHFNRDKRDWIYDQLIQNAFNGELFKDIDDGLWLTQEPDEEIFSFMLDIHRQTDDLEQAQHALDSMKFDGFEIVKDQKITFFKWT